MQQNCVSIGLINDTENDYKRVLIDNKDGATIVSVAVEMTTAIFSLHPNVIEIGKLIKCMLDCVYCIGYNAGKSKRSLPDFIVKE